MFSTVCLLLLLTTSCCLAASGAAAFFGGSASGSAVVSGYSSPTNSGSFVIGANGVSFASNIRGIAHTDIILSVSSNTCNGFSTQALIQLFDSANNVVLQQTVIPSSGPLNFLSSAVFQSTSVVELRLQVSGCSAAISNVQWSAYIPISV
jgi:hypothetical protein